jgi:hypothetical protein
MVIIYLVLALLPLVANAAVLKFVNLPPSTNDNGIVFDRVSWGQSRDNTGKLILSDDSPIYVNVGALRRQTEEMRNAPCSTDLNYLLAHALGLAVQGIDVNDYSELSSGQIITVEIKNSQFVKKSKYICDQTGGETDNFIIKINGWSKWAKNVLKAITNQKLPSRVE